MTPPPHVRLRAVTEADLPILFEHQRDPQAARMAAFPPRDRDAFFAHWRRILGDPAIVARAIVVDDEVIGHVGIWDGDDGRLVGYWIGRRWWGRGCATAALVAFLGQVPTRPLLALVAEHNAGSIRVLEKCGFTRSEARTAARSPSDDGVVEVVFERAER